MNPNSIEHEFRNRVCEQISVEQEGEARFRVLTPFRFEDGDHFGIFLKKAERDQWILTDEATTLMHLSYWLDETELASGNRRQIIEGALAGFSVENRDGELIIPVSEGRFGDALFNLIQALAKVTDVSFLSREVVRSTFIEDLRAFLQAHVAEDRLTFGWTDPERDRKKRYPVDCRINQIPRPIFVCALPSETRVRDATINLLKFEQWGLQFQSLGIFEEQETISPNVVARFTDVCDKTFSSLDGNAERIEKHLKRTLQTSG